MYSFKRSSPASVPRKAHPLFMRITQVFRRKKTPLIRQKLRVKKVLEISENENMDSRRRSYKIWVFYSLILVVFVSIFSIISRAFYHAEFQMGQSYLLLVNGKNQTTQDDVFYLFSFRGKASELHMIELPTEQVPLLDGDVSLTTLARSTAIFADGSIESQQLEPVRSKWDLIELLLQGVMDDGQLRSIGWADRWKMIGYLMMMHGSDFKMQEVTLSESCDDCMYEYAVQTLIPRYLMDTRLVSQNTTIGVINQTGVNGLAKKVSDVFKAYGSSVVHISSDNEQDAQSKIIVTKNDVQTQYAVSKIQSLFFSPIPVEVNPQAFTLYRSDIILIVGEDTQWQ